MIAFSCPKPRAHLGDGGERLVGERQVDGLAALVAVPSPLAGEGMKAFQQILVGEGFSS
jgi:hypothetical protein